MNFLGKFEKWFSTLILKDKIMCFQNQEMVLKEAKFIELNYLVLRKNIRKSE